MNPEEVAERLRQGIADARVDVQGGGDRFEIRVVSPAFEGKRRVGRQQLVYGCINDLLRDGTIHAVTIDARTPEEVQGADGQGRT